MKNSALHSTGPSTPICLPDPDGRPGSGFNFTPVENYRRAIFLCFFLVVLAPVCSYGSIWSGNKNSDWFDAGNWLGGEVPESSSSIIIWDGPNDPVISAAGAVGRDLTLEAGAVLTITAAGTLTLNGNISGVINRGTVHNHGTISINSLTSLAGGIGIDNSGAFTNYADGDISIDRQEDAGIQNGATFINEGDITIGAITALGSYGIRNFAAFYNNTGGQIKIDHSGVNGVFNQQGTFQNTGILTIGGEASPGERGILNFATFHNNTGGQIMIDRSSNTGLIVQNGTFQNAGSLIIGGEASPGNFGLVNQGTFNNNTGGEIMIDRWTTTGLRATLGVFNNNASVIIGGSANPVGSSLLNNATINNNACAKMEIYGVFTNSTAVFNNAGLLTLSSTSAHTNTAVVNNNGVIEYQQGPLIPNVTNNDLIIKDISGSCSTYSPALQIGGGNSFTPAATWYKDVAQTQVAGTYNLASNTFTPTNLPGPGIYPLYFNVADNANGCTEAVSLNYTQSNDVTPPTLHCRPIIFIDLNAAGTVGITPASVFQSGSDNCGVVNLQSVSPNVFNCTNLDGNDVTLVADDGNGNTAMCQVVVWVSDITAPTVVCKSATVNLDASGVGSIMTSNVFQSGSDACGTVNQVSVVPNAFTCANLGANTVTLTVNDGHDNTATCTATVTVTENIAPTVVCKNATVNLDASGSASLPTGSVFQSGSDNCGMVNPVSVSPNAFTCANVGANTVTLLVNDGHGNTANCTATVTVTENTAPTVVCKNATVNLDASGSASITTGSVFQSGSDNCGTVNQQSVSPASFTCGNVGANPVTLTVNDGHGNTGTCTATVTVADNSAPTVVCKSSTVNLDASGSVSLPTASVFQSGSDNCGTVNQVSVTPNAFTCANIGANTVTLLVNDGHGNTANCTATVTVTENTAPTVVCKNATVNLDASGLASISTAGVFQSGSDNCGTVNQQSVSPASFTCSNVGANTVTLTVNDGHGNTGTCTATVTVVDNIAPTVVCKNATLNLDASGSGNLSAAAVFQSGTDNCGTVNPGTVSPSSFSCNNLASNTVTLTANDGHGNTAICTATVTVADAIAPTMLCKPVTLALNAAGNATLTLAQVNNGSYDNCILVSMVLSRTTFSCVDIGNKEVFLNGVDGSNNTGACSAIVTVVDLTLPSAKCKNITANLNAAGLATPAASAVDNGSADNCGFTLTLSPATFNCGNIGANIVTLKATDNGGNTATCTAVVTVKDVMGPTALCKNPIIYLDDTGHATLTAANVNNGSNDACGIQSMSINNNQFDCSNISGTYPVTLTVRDLYNNQSTCTGMVTVKDNIAPIAICGNLSVQLNAQGIATVNGANLAADSYDNCSVWSYSPIVKVYTKTNLGVNNLTITVKDWSGNAAPCTSQVTVLPYGGGAMLVQNNQTAADSPDEPALEREAENEAQQLSDRSFDLALFPNPTIANVTLRFSLPAEQAFRVRVFDLTGRLVVEREGKGGEGDNRLPLDLAELRAGLYLVELQSGVYRAQQQLVVLRD